LTVVLTQEAMLTKLGVEPSLQQTDPGPTERQRNVTGFTVVLRAVNLMLYIISDVRDNFTVLPTTT